MKSYFKLLLLTLTGVFILSCQNEELPKQESTPPINENLQKMGNKVILGKKLENPYSLENMQKALQIVQEKQGSYSKFTSKITIAPTHYYYKFIPKNEAEYDILESDSNLELYDYPLDYEILQMGDYYHDPSVPQGQPTYQYAAVKVGTPLPEGVSYTLLASLYIPDQEDIPDDVSEMIVDEALRLTNNLENENLTQRQSKWRPAGTIMAWDDVIGSVTTTTQVFSHWEYEECVPPRALPKAGISDNDMGANGRPNPNPNNLCHKAVYKTVTNTTQGSYIPVEGVKVRARRWFTTHTGITNAQGRYECDGQFKRPANYSIKWDRHDFSIRWSWITTAKHGGPKIEGDWNLNIRGGEQQYYATIFRAAHHYFYKDIKGLRRPPQNSFWRTQLKYRAFYQDSDNNGNHKASRRFLGLGSAIKLFDGTRRTDEIYGTVIHETAHASHWKMDKENYNTMNLCSETFLGLSCSGDPSVAESWARGVQWELTRMVYLNYAPSYSRLRYTGICEDLIDGFKTRESFRFWTINDPWASQFRTYNDRVQNYTIRQLEDALIGQKTWEDWKNNIINTINNDTSNKVHEAFNFWNMQ